MLEMFWLFFTILFLEYYSQALILRSVFCERSEQALEFTGPEGPEILVVKKGLHIPPSKFSTNQLLRNV